MPHGYAHHEQRVYLGMGDRSWERAKQALRQWAMFPASWTAVHPKPTLDVGAQVLVSAKLLGLWWHNPTRIVYTIDESDEFGFAYGTLPGHLAQGEERFSVERDAEGNVYYLLRVFSRPSFWGAKLLRAYMRMQQVRFREDSAQAMLNFVRADGSQLESRHRAADDFKMLVYDQDLHEPIAL